MKNIPRIALLIVLLISMITLAYAKDPIVIKDFKEGSQITSDPITIINSVHVNELCVKEDILSAYNFNDPAVVSTAITLLSSYPKWDIKGNILLSLLDVNKCDGESFNCEVTLHLSYWQHNSTFISSNTLTPFTLQPDNKDITLSISYDKRTGKYTTDKSLHEIPNVHYLTAQITNINTHGDPSLLNYLHLETNLEIKRFEDLSITAPPDITNEVLSNDYIELTWLPVSGAESYELEWTFVEAYSDNLSNAKPITDVMFDFNYNSSRVLLTGNTYKIRNIFEVGYVFYRVRAIGLGGTDYTDRVEGPWSFSGPYNHSTLYPNLGNNTDVPSDKYWTLIDNTITLGPRHPIPHETGFNWMYECSFEEEGKTKEMVSYYDGTLRNRQTVLFNNTDAIPIVKEVIYDFQGRPAIDILPSPADPSQNYTNIIYPFTGVKPSLRYYSNFNLSDPNNAPYSRNDFDPDVSCVAATKPLLSASGAGQYYSNNNPYITTNAGGVIPNKNDFIPVAQGFPFLQTEYTPDNSGRISRKSGVGIDHKLDNGHEVKFFYGTPFQEELDRLFGENVGLSDHYKKEVVVDANSQVSVTYKDLKGAVIATAMTGNAPAGIKELDDVSPLAEIPVDLLSKNNTSSEEGTIESSRTFTVSVAGVHKIHYSIDASKYDPSSDNPNCDPGLCFDCVYDLELSIKDNCLIERLPGNVPIKKTIGPLNLLLNNSCDGTTNSYSSANEPNQVNQNGEIEVYLEVGSYTITKKLKINEDALNYYTSQYLQNASCLKTFDWFNNQALARIDLTKCNEMSCSTCKVKLGTSMSDYVSKQILAGSTKTNGELEFEYQKKMLDCDKLCNKQNICETYYRMLVNDMKPGGQYFKVQIDPTTKQYFADNNSGADHYNILNDPSNNSIIYYKSPTLSFNQDLPGKPRATVLINGVLKTIDQLSVDEFVSNFKDEWADELVKSHPEYCRYLFCIKNELSNQHDMDMWNTEHYADAKTKGFLDPFDANIGDPFLVLKTTNSNGIQFRVSGLSDEDFNALKYKIDHFWTDNDNNTSLPLLDICIGIVYCSKKEKQNNVYIGADGLAHYQNPNQPFIDCINSFKNNPSQCPDINVWDKIWQMYRSIYLSEKGLVYQFMRDRSCAIRPELLTPAKVSRIPDLNTSTTQANKTTQENLVVSECSQRCNDYADVWMEKLKNCNISDYNKSLIRQELVKVCELGCDVNHPFASSSVATKYLTDPNVKYKSFDDVIKKMRIYVEGICDANLITMPRPYDHDYLAGNSPYADTCNCDREFTPSCTFKVLSIGSNGEAIYIGDRLEAIAAQQTDPCTTCGDKTKEILASDKILNPTSGTQPSCLKCLKCDKLYDAVKAFYKEYALSAISTDMTFNPMFLNFINGYVGYNLTLLDYRLFMKTCMGSTTDESILLTTNNYYAYYLNLFGEDDVRHQSRDVMVYDSYYNHYFDTYSTIGYYAGANRSICQGVQTVLGSGAMPGYRYEWSPAMGLNGPDLASPTATPMQTQTYTLRVYRIADNALVTMDNVTITVTCCNCVYLGNGGGNGAALVSNGGDENTLLNPLPVYSRYICKGSSIIIGDDILDGSVVSWTPNSDLTNVTNSTIKKLYTPTVTGSFKISAFVNSQYTVDYSFIVIDCNQSITICKGESIDIGAVYLPPIGHPLNPATSYLWSPSSGLSTLITSKTKATPSQTTTYTLTITNPYNDQTQTITQNITITVIDCDGPGPNKKKCGDQSVDLGEGLEDPDYDYWWDDGQVSRPRLHVTVNPSVTTTYVLHKKPKNPEVGSEKTWTITVSVTDCANIPCHDFAAAVNEFESSNGYTAQEGNNGNTASFTGSKIIGTASYFSDLQDYLNAFFHIKISIADLKRMLHACLGRGGENQCCRIKKSTSVLNNFQIVLDQMIKKLNNIPQSIILENPDPGGIILATLPPPLQSGSSVSFNEYSVVNVPPVFPCDQLDVQQPTSITPCQRTFTVVSINNGIMKIRYDRICDVAYADPCCQFELSFKENSFNFGGIVGFSDINTEFKYCSGDEPARKNMFTIVAHFWDGSTALLEGFIGCLDLGTEVYFPCPTVCNKPINYPVPHKKPCEDQLREIAKANAMQAYHDYLKTEEKKFRSLYIAHCLGAINSENFYMKIPDRQYHYTLYYYDQANNLIATVPPAGVHLITSPIDLSTVISNRKSASATIQNRKYPSHTFITNYAYNTLNQVVKQTTPDAGESNFWYDAVGRLVFSQNAKQKDLGHYSYTTYDKLGRIHEVGELSDLTSNFQPAAPAITWISTPGLIRNQITRTFYDYPIGMINSNINIGTPNFTQVSSTMRGRVSGTTFQNKGKSDESQYDHAVYYSYDVHGNVKSLLREITALKDVGANEYKQVDYDYDLVSGNVNKVYYQQGEPDQFFHKYDYDADNRLKQVYTSPNDKLSLYEKDARYEFYLHGPLSRVEIGQSKVQGMDYVYTIHGWLKGVNSSNLDMNREIGKDGSLLPGNLHSNVAADEFGFTLGYYEGDYKSAYQFNLTGPSFNYFDIQTASSNVTSDLGAASSNLYNGNIRLMMTAIQKFMFNNIAITGTSYHYDQLNRLVSSDVYASYGQPANYPGNSYINTWASGGAAAAEYHNYFEYDPNGNITKQVRNGNDNANPLMDDLTYKYYSNTNQLRYVKEDPSVTSNYDDDIKNQEKNQYNTADHSNDNYTYDKIGNLTSDASEEIQTIEWNVYGKISKITRTGSSTKPDLEFEYTPDGYRAVKIVKPKDGYRLWQYTYYMHDAHGNILATYERNTDKEINSGNITYADINNSLISHSGTTEFATFINQLQNTDMANFKSDYFTQIQINSNDLPLYGQIDLQSILNNNPTLMNFVITNYNTSNLVTAIIQLKGSRSYLMDLFNLNMSDFLTLCFTFDRLAYLQSLATNYNDLFNNLCATFGIGMGDQNDMINQLINQLQNGAITDNDLVNWFIANGIDGNINAFVMQSTPMPSLVAMLSTYNNIALLTQGIYPAIDISSALNSFDQQNLIAFLHNNFVYFSQFINTNFTPDLLSYLINLYPGYVASLQTANSYFDIRTGYLDDKVRTYFGEQFYNDLLQQFKNGSNRYIETFALSEWYIYGSDRLGSQHANVIIHTTRYELNGTGTGNISVPCIASTTIDVSGSNINTNLAGNATVYVQKPVDPATTNTMVNNFVYRTLLNFNTGVVPAGKEILSASLILSPLQGTPSFPYNTPNQVVVKKVTNSWAESTVTGAAVPPTTDDDAIYLQSYNGSYVQNVDVTQQLKDMLKPGAANFGFMLQLADEVNLTAVSNGVAFASRYNSNTNLQPKLSITYRDVTVINNTDVTTPTGPDFIVEHGRKNYELKNHLGNVMVVVTDKKIPNCNSTVLLSENFDNFTTSNWSVMGAATQLIEKGKLKVQGTSGSTAAEGIYQTLATTAAHSYIVNMYLKATNADVGKLTISAVQSSNSAPLGTITYNGEGWYNFNFIANTTGTNLMVSLTGNRSTYTYWIDEVKVEEQGTGTFQNYKAEVIQATDYSAFGAPLLGRTWYANLKEKYRFGFDKQERDDEIAGMGNIMTAEYWEYDTRLGRRWNVDPITYPWQSAYAVFNNNPIAFTDPLGLVGGNPGEPPKTQNTVGVGGSIWSWIKTSVGWEGKGAVAKLAETVIMAKRPSLLAIIWARTKYFSSVVRNWVKDSKFSAEGSAKIDFGIQARLSASFWGLKGTADVNVIKANLYTVTAPFNNGAWTHDYAGKKGTLITNSLGLSVETPLKTPWGKLGIGGTAEQSMRIDGELYDHEYKTDYGIYAIVPVLQPSSAKKVAEKMESIGLSGMGKPPKITTKEGKIKDFYGLDVGAGAALFLGIDINVKVGFYK